MTSSEGQPLCLTTRHGKDKALSRPFATGLGLQLQVYPGDTDQLGTFSGEIARQGDALSAVRRKVMLGLEATGLRYGLASEASFGPHPAAAMLPVGQELLLFIDREQGIEVLEQRLELRTNYSQRRLGVNDDPSPWLKQMGFPRHGVIARPAAANLEHEREAPLFKGLRSAAELEVALQICRAADPNAEVWLESDMRAHMNPTRMASIRRLGFALVRRLRTPCPRCGGPGWGQIATEAGLPCSWCGEPTALTRSELWACPSCGEQRSLPRRDGLLKADPGQCSWCNP